MRVLLLEAGGDDENDNYRVPSFHGFATEDEAYRWDFFVRHSADDEQQRRDSKYVPDRDGVLYPRSGTLGGCTAHNAMITVYPHNEDWDTIARLMDDPSWASEAMRTYFERLERCTYIDRPWRYPRIGVVEALLRRLRFLSGRFENRSRHGWEGWLATSLAEAELAAEDKQLLRIVLAAAKATLSDTLGRPLRPFEDFDQFRDPNDWRVQDEGALGLWSTPLAVHNGVRNGTRELILRTAAEHPENLTVRTHALAARVLFEGTRAVGVEYLEGPRLYRAAPGSEHAPADPPRRQALARREVVLAAGAFNTPQLLKLSGVGPPDELAEHRIEVRVPLAGVGDNLQDRYEVGVVYELNRDFTLIRECTFRPPGPGEQPDPCFADWQRGEGVYTTNGVVLAIVRESRADLPAPDLIVFGVPSDFRGYEPGYSERLKQGKNLFTWAILKARTKNTGGTVRLRSADPRDPPAINFHYFEEGTDSGGEDLDAVVDGVDFVRRLMEHAEGVVESELVPGPDVRTTDQLREFVRNEAWGHHATCTCKLGRADDPLAVVDSDFRVYGTEGLRIVDASVFPAIPGFFVVTSIYMLAEKASHVILAAAN
jgi:choline dehydrogenase